MALEDVATSLATLLGVSTDVAGLILFGVMAVTFIIAFMWALSGRGSSMAAFFGGFGLAVILATGFGWVALWVPVFVGLIILAVWWFGLGE